MILDVGCGDHPAGDVNVDLKHIGNWVKNFVQASIYLLPFRDGAFETVRCSNVLEHKGINVRKAVCELLRVCYYMLVVTVPSFLALRLHPRVHKDHARLFTGRQLKQLFSNYHHDLTVAHSSFIFNFPPLFYVPFRYTITVWKEKR